MQKLKEDWDCKIKVNKFDLKKRFIMYKIDWKEGAFKDLEKLEASVSRRIFKKVDELSEDPFSKDIKRLKGRDDFRLRVGDYRVLFLIEGEIIQILKVGHRKNIYER
jgi:mRNA interferase RelE/StbE